MMAEAQPSGWLYKVVMTYYLMRLRLVSAERAACVLTSCRLAMAGMCAHRHEPGGSCEAYTEQSEGVLLVKTYSGF